MIRTEVIAASASHIWGMFFPTGLRRLDCATVLILLRSTSMAKPAKSEAYDVPEADKAGHLALAIRAKKCHYALVSGIGYRMF